MTKDQKERVTAYCRARSAQLDAEIEILRIESPEGGPVTGAEIAELRGIQKGLQDLHSFIFQHIKTTL